ncbi:MAG: hypothetical protein WDZ80_06965 [Candidatus Paceibacterota bacterium]
MGEGLLISIFGASAFEIIKRLLNDIFGKENDELTRKVYGALEVATDRFFEKYGDEFGEASNSFLAREENWQIILSSIYYSSGPLQPSDLNPKGFTDVKNATPLAINFLISCIEEEMHKDWFLDKILTEKFHQKKVVENQDKMANALQNILDDSNEKKKNEHRLAHPDYPDGWLPEEGKPYTQHFSNGGKVNFVRRGNIIHLEQTLPSGATAYYEIDPDGNLKDVDFPYPLEEYTLVIPDEIILRKHEKILPNGLIQTQVKLKWGKGDAKYITDSMGKLGFVSLKCRSIVKHEERLIEIPIPKFSK